MCIRSCAQASLLTRRQDPMGSRSNAGDELPVLCPLLPLAPPKFSVPHSGKNLATGLFLPLLCQRWQYIVKGRMCLPINPVSFMGKLALDFGSSGADLEGSWRGKKPHPSLLPIALMAGCKRDTAMCSCLWPIMSSPEGLLGQ